MNSKAVLTGKHIFSGNHACVEGALSAGCTFLAYYPIVPALEFVERFTNRCREFDSKNMFIQMEDEISALAAVLGATFTGRKAMTITSGSGFSLMMEHIGLGVMLEVPCVIVDVQRIGAGEGNPLAPSQNDVMQARWGSHGDYEIIALAPSSVQECYDFTIKAFNLSEKYRTPVVVLADEQIAHTISEITIPHVNEIKLEPRKYYKGSKEKYEPFNCDNSLVPPIVDVGAGYRFHVTGLTHNAKGYPVMNEECQELTVHRLVNKIRLNADKIIEVEIDRKEDSEILVVSYGTTSKIATKAIEQAKKEGMKIGHLKLITIWPFADKIIDELARKVRSIIVPEMNYGQIVLEVERCSHGQANVVFTRCEGEETKDVENLLSAIKKATMEQNLHEGIIEYKNE